MSGTLVVVRPLAAGAAVGGLGLQGLDLRGLDGLLAEDVPRGVGRLQLLGGGVHALGRGCAGAGEEPVGHGDALEVGRRVHLHPHPAQVAVLRREEGRGRRAELALDVADSGQAEVPGGRAADGAVGEEVVGELDGLARPLEDRRFRRGLEGGRIHLGVDLLAVAPRPEAVPVAVQAARVGGREVLGLRVDDRVDGLRGHGRRAAPEGAEAEDQAEGGGSRASREQVHGQVPPRGVQRGTFTTRKNATLKRPRCQG